MNNKGLKFAFGLLILGVSSASTALATTSFCSAVSPGTAIDAFPSTNTPPFGCGQSDISFTDFSATTGIGNLGPVPGPDDVYLYTGGTTPTVDAYFNTPGPGPTWSVTTTGDQLDSILSYVATTTGEFASLAIPLTTADYTGTGTAFTITETYCLGETTIAGCPGGQQGSFEVEVAGSSIAFNTGGGALPSGYSVVAIQEEIVMQDGYSLLTLPNEFDEDAPEPSTFVLLATALGALFFAKYRRSRGTPLV